MPRRIRPARLRLRYGKTVFATFQPLPTAPRAESTDNRTWENDTVLKLGYVTAGSVRSVMKHVSPTRPVEAGSLRNSVNACCACATGRVHSLRPSRDTVFQSIAAVLAISARSSSTRSSSRIAHASEPLRREGTNRLICCGVPCSRRAGPTTRMPSSASGGAMTPAPASWSSMTACNDATEPSPPRVRGHVGTVSPASASRCHQLRRVIVGSQLSAIH